MAKFTIEITNPASLSGITAAREARNATLTPQMSAEVKDKDGNVTKPSAPLPISTHPDYIGTDTGYVQFVMASAAESYAKQYGKV